MQDAALDILEKLVQFGKLNDSDQVCISKKDVNKRIKECEGEEAEDSAKRWMKLKDLDESGCYMARNAPTRYQDLKKTLLSGENTQLPIAEQKDCANGVKQYSAEWRVKFSWPEGRKCSNRFTGSYGAKTVDSKKLGL